MSDIALRVENLGKRYRIGEFDHNRAIRQALYRWGTTPLRRLFGRNGQRPRSQEDDPDHIWALKDVSFEVKRGEVVGFIGRNGAGKSTLLKILSRITEPTTGRAEICGRVGSLLEVGTGFHKELTGRENVFLNGAILGMTRAEIQRKFDDIVEFSGVEKFLDTPVKRYSSGMRVRLGFAVAAHLDPEILIVDEVLAVGDVEFQQKCLGKMQDVARSGRTVLFVSHKMESVQHLCSRAVVLASGELGFDGSTTGAIAAYIGHSRGDGWQTLDLQSFRDAGYEPIIQKVRVRNADGKSTTRIRSGERMTVEIEYNAPCELRNPVLGVRFDSLLGQTLFTLQSRFQHGLLDRLPERGIAQCRLPKLPLMQGQYSLSFGFSVDGTQRDRLEHALRLEVVASDFFNTGYLPNANQGPVLLDAEWSFGQEIV